MVRAMALIVLLLGMSACAHIDIPREEARAMVHAWEALQYELSELTNSTSISRERLIQDAQDWHVLALELNTHMRKNFATSGASAQDAQHSRQIGMAPPPPGMYGGGVNFGHSMLALGKLKKSRVLNELANKQNDLASALMNMSETNKLFLRSGGQSEQLYALQEAYSVGRWAIGKYTEFLREKVRMSSDSASTKPLTAGSASKALREIYGI